MKVVALGNDNAGDDGAALLAAKQVAANTVAASVKSSNPPTENTPSKSRISVKPEFVFAGRVGTELLDIFDSTEPIILLDVVTGSGPPGHILRLGFDELINYVAPGRQVSSHGFGPAEVLQLGQALGRSLPGGCFIGIEGHHFGPGRALSAAVNAAMGAFVETIQTAINEFYESYP